MLRVAAIAGAATVMSGPAAQALVPMNGGTAGGTAVTVNASAGDQTDPHISGDLVTYTDVNSGKVRYHDLQSGADLAVPGSDVDTIADVSGSRIAFIRLSSNGDRSVGVYDVASGTLASFDHGVLAYEPFGTAIGGSTIAFEDLNTGHGDIMVADVDAPTAPFVNLSDSTVVDEQPEVAPQGDLVVWEACDTPMHCGIYKASRTGGSWGPPLPVTATSATTELNADTDGTTIVYDSSPSPTGLDIVLQPVAGGPPTRLELPGAQRNPSISQGVVAFESFDGTQTDVFLYVIATNTLYRITDTPGNEVLNDVAVLPNGDVHVSWAADEPGGAVNTHDIQARTVRLPALDSTPPTISRTVAGTPGDNGWYTSDVALTWTISEPESPGSLTKTGCADQSITSDRAATTYSCTASSDGGAAGPVDVTLKRDATPPTISFTGNADTYNVAQTVAIGCSAGDNLSGIASGCSDVNAPAYTFGLGSNTIRRSARDNAGNVASASTSFTVIVSPTSLCALTRDFVHSSAAYQALRPVGQRVIDVSVSAACAFLTQIGPQVVPSHKAQFIKAYKQDVDALASAGWLTSAQAATLGLLAEGL